MDTPKVSPRAAVIAAALLITALAVVVIYTSARAFHSFSAIVVLAAIGVAALLMQLRLRGDMDDLWGRPLWLNAAGIVLAIFAIFGDKLRLRPGLVQVGALGAILCFGAGGVILLRAMRRKRILPK